MSKKLYKITAEKKVEGVCAGFAEYLNLDVTLIRILTALIAFIFPFGFIFYIICAFVMPDKSQII